MSAILTTSRLHAAAREHLRGRLEQVGFFLADFDATRQAFELRAWRPMAPGAFEIQTSYHVALRDEVRPEIIKWAWDSGACLAEVHSHGDTGIACFSSSDMSGFEEWVPHVRWRLRGLPYVAIVTAGDTFDALAWIDSSREPAQIEQLTIDDYVHLATRRTLSRLVQAKEHPLGN